MELEELKNQLDALRLEIENIKITLMEKSVEEEPVEEDNTPSEKDEELEF